MGNIIEDEQVKIPEILPMLPVRDTVIFPYMILPLFVGRESSIKAVDEALAKDRMIFLATQKVSTDDNPAAESIYSVGTAAMVMKMLKLPDGRVKILVQGLAKGMIKEYVQEKPMFVVRVQKVVEPAIGDLSLETEALVRSVKEQSEKVLSLKGILSPDVLAILDQIEEPGRLADLVASNLKLKIEEAQKILETFHPLQRLKKVNEFLSKEVQVSTMQAKIQSQAREEMSKTQREYFLREQLKAIKAELGEIDEKAQEVNELREKIKKAKMPPEVEKESNKQLSRLEQMHPESAEATIVRTYLDWLVEIPWSVSTEDNLDIKKAKQVLDEDHYDLEKVKERILEYLGVRKLKEKMKGPILCFVGPPGVGKTSLGKSIARALGRKFTRISLGGIRDEAEIRGHRRTYIGSLPGRIIQGIKTAGSNNPVFMLDEIDKVGTDFRGDPSAALLEALDPEQNFAFSDHYLNVPFDLSRVMFITTANILDPIPPALKDRMEVINLAGYTSEEKLKIARQFLVLRQLEENGITKDSLSLSDEAILRIISQYTKEAGVRNLEREIASVCRKVARKIAEDEKGPFQVSSLNLHKYLGVPKYLPEEELEVNEIGVATGLAWTSVGGEILHVEATTMKGKGNLTLTGHLGDLHVHVPAGAIPKDGPSAGVTMATSLISALIRIPVRKDIAMTGEITLRGRVLPIGGVKEKTLAALRAGIKTVIIPHQNQKDLDEIPQYIRRRVNYIFVKDMDEILKKALVPEKARPKAEAAEKEPGGKKGRSESAPLSLPV
jgi:ATP-dependent Lon protease